MNTNLRSLCATLAAGVVSITAFAAGAAAQYADAPAPQQTERFRAALSGRLTEMQQRQRELESLLARIDAGESTDELRRAMREALAAGMQRHRERADAGAPRERMDAMMRVLGEVDPPMRDRIRRAMADNPEHARRMVDQASPRLREMMEMQERNPEQFRSRVQTLRAARASFDTARRLNQAVRDGADAGEIGRLRAELFQSVAQRIDLEMQERERSIENMAERLETLRNELAAMRADREAMIVRQAQRLEEAAGAERGMGGAEMRRGHRGGEGEQGRPAGPRSRDAKRPE